MTQFLLSSLAIGHRIERNGVCITKFPPFAEETKQNKKTTKKGALKTRVFFYME